MHTWTVIAFLLAAASCVVSCMEKVWALALLAAGFAVWLVPAAFQTR
jgi:hypothetical protein